MNSDFILLEESKSTIAIACPKCKSVEAINKSSLSACNSLKEKHTCTCGFQSTIINTNYIEQKIKSNSKIAGSILLAGVLLVILGIVLMSTSKYDGSPQVFTGFAFMVSGIIFIILSLKYGTKTIELKKRGDNALTPYINIENDELFMQCGDILNEKIKQYGMPNGKKVISIKNKTKNLQSGKWYVWVNDNVLNLFPRIELDSEYPEHLVNKIRDASVKTIPLDRIEYYATRGEIVHENKITGGGGGGSSIGGAVVGGIIAGGAGAVIGSRKKTDPIKSELITHDTRECYINYFDKDGTKKSIFLEYADYQTLKDLIPEKDYCIVSAIMTSSIVQSVQSQDKTKTISDQIRELAKLKDEGILSEEEFLEKKKVLLDKI